jgi:hypothetical protein
LQRTFLVLKSRPRITRFECARHSSDHGTNFALVKYEVYFVF